MNKKMKITLLVIALITSISLSYLGFQYYQNLMIEKMIAEQKIEKENNKNLIKEFSIGNMSLGQEIVNDEIPGLGVPDSKTDEVFEEDMGKTVTIWTKGDLLELGLEVKENKKYVDSIKITGMMNLKTDRGIGIGNTLEEVKKVYSDEISDKYTNENMVVIGSIYDGLLIEILDGKVNSIFLGSVPQF